MSSVQSRRSPDCSFWTIRLAIYLKGKLASNCKTCFGICLNLSWLLTAVIWIWSFESGCLWKCQSSVAAECSCWGIYAALWHSCRGAGSNRWTTAISQGQKDSFKAAHLLFLWCRFAGLSFLNHYLKWRGEIIFNPPTHMQPYDIHVYTHTHIPLKTNVQLLGKRSFLV